MRLIAIATVVVFTPATLMAQDSIECHKTATPSIVTDWELSMHSVNGVECSVCHGAEHVSASDVAKAQIPTPETCIHCHERQVKEFSAGKHAAAWAAMVMMITAAHLWTTLHRARRRLQAELASVRPA